MTEYNDDDRIAIFKEDPDERKERAPHWTGKLTLSEETLEHIEETGETSLRVAVWKTNFSSKDGFFLSGQVKPFLRKEEETKKSKKKPKKAPKKSDSWDDDDDF